MYLKWFSGEKCNIRCVVIDLYPLKGTFNKSFFPFDGIKAYTHTVTTAYSITLLKGGVLRFPT